MKKIVQDPDGKYDFEPGKPNLLLLKFPFGKGFWDQTIVV